LHVTLARLVELALSADFTSSVMRRGTTFDTTEIDPSPPSARIGSVSSSSPERTVKPAGWPRMHR
jgi:hypothetical protein